VSAAEDIHLSAPGAMVRLSLPFDPPMLQGIKIHPENPFRFDFILDKGDSGLSVETPLMASLLKQEANKLIKYFLASLTIPDKDLWVNLSPYEKDRIIPQSFGLTAMGRDLLAEDYMLKQVTASLIYPEDMIGKKFWKRIYEEAFKKYGTTDIAVNTFNKVWIVPQKAVVFENAKAGTAYVVESQLKVMLEQDYLSLSHHVIQAPQGNSRSSNEEVNALGSKIIREIVLPELNKEVNEGKNFSYLRQIYNSLILAAWYKKKIKNSILSQVYADKNKVDGININDPQEKEKIYQQYLKAFKKGVYNYIKEDTDLYTQQPVPRKYFSGGLDCCDIGMTVLKVISNPAMITKKMILTGLTGLALVVGITLAITETKSSTPPIASFVKMAKNDPQQALQRFPEYKAATNSMQIVNNAIAQMGGDDFRSTLYLYSEDVWNAWFDRHQIDPTDFTGADQHLLDEDIINAFFIIDDHKNYQQSWKLIQYLIKKDPKVFFDMVTSRQFGSGVPSITKLYVDTLMAEIDREYGIPRLIENALKNNGIAEPLETQDVKFTRDVLKKFPPPGLDILKWCVQVDQTTNMKQWVAGLHGFVQAYEHEPSLARKQLWISYYGASDSVVKIADTINSMHGQPGAVRFAPLKGATADDLYWFLALDNSGLYTSTVHGIDERFQNAMKAEKIGGFDVIKHANFRGTRIVINLLSSYGLLNSFLNTMSPNDQNTVLTWFIKGVDSQGQETPMEKAVTIGDTIQNVTDPRVAGTLQDLLKVQYYHAVQTGDQEGVIINGILASSVGQQNVVRSSDRSWFAKASELYPLPDNSKLSANLLFHNNVDIQRYVFFPDPDGNASYYNFLNSHKNPYWKIDVHRTYVQVSTKVGMKIEIFANIPSQPSGEGDLDALLANTYVPVWVMRAHNFWFPEFIKHVPSNAVLVYLGPCGGYNYIKAVMDKARGAQIVATDETGSMFVNDPLLGIIDEEMREGRLPLDWNVIWEKASKLLGGNENFGGYRSPAKNTAERFYQEYQELEKDKQNHLLRILPNISMVTPTHNVQIAFASENTGGIDLTSSNLNLQIQNTDKGIQFNVNPAILKLLQNAHGFTIGSMTIKSLKSLPEFLGLNEIGENAQL